VKVVLVFPADTLTGDAAVNYRIIERAGLPIIDLASNITAEGLDSALAGCDWVVDGLLGTGASGEPRFPLDLAIQAINRAAAKRLAIDLPSGLDCDTGQPSAATVRAHHTCTFVAEKVGFAAPEAASYLGVVHVVDIGVPRRLLDDIAARREAP
jgi:NAD(P)H-hydrate epimerase